MDNSVTREDIKNAYLESWDTGCKGITVFRDGCKDVQVLNIGTKNGGVKINEVAPVVINEPLRNRPYKVNGSTYRMNTPVGTAFITINEDELGEPLEMFVNVGKAGSDVASQWRRHWVGQFPQHLNLEGKFLQKKKRENLQISYQELGEEGQLVSDQPK